MVGVEKGWAKIYPNSPKEIEVVGSTQIVYHYERSDKDGAGSFGVGMVG